MCCLALRHSRVPLVPAAGNKLRKLDGIAAEWRSSGVTDVVTCGGAQSAHTAAIGTVAATTSALLFIARVLAWL